MGQKQSRMRRREKETSFYEREQSMPQKTTKFGKRYGGTGYGPSSGYGTYGPAMSPYGPGYATSGYGTGGYGGYGGPYGTSGFGGYERTVPDYSAMGGMGGASTMSGFPSQGYGGQQYASRQGYQQPLAFPYERSSGLAGIPQQQYEAPYERQFEEEPQYQQYPQQPASFAQEPLPEEFMYTPTYAQPYQPAQYTQAKPGQFRGTMNKMMGGLYTGTGRMLRSDKMVTKGQDLKTTGAAQVSAGKLPINVPTRGTVGPGTVSGGPIGQGTVSGPVGGSQMYSSRGYGSEPVVVEKSSDIPEYSTTSGRQGMMPQSQTRGEEGIVYEEMVYTRVEEGGEMGNGGGSSGPSGRGGGASAVETGWK